MKELLILKIFDLFKFVFLKSGINYDQFRTILQLKFNLDKRKSIPGFKGLSRPKKKEIINPFWGAILLYALFGLAFSGLVVPLMMRNFYLGISTYFVIFITFLSLSIVIEFSTDIFDISSQKILLTKPVDRRTLNLAKNIHVLVYLSQLGLAFSFGLSVFIFFMFGKLLAFAFLFIVILCLFFLVFSSAIMYGLILKKFTGEKLKDIINYVQIFFSVTIFVGYQAFIQTSEYWMENIDKLLEYKIIYLLPPFWFGAPLQIIHSGNFNLGNISMSILVLFISIGGYLFYFKKIGPRFEKDLYRFSINEEHKKIKKKSKPHFILKFLKSGTTKAFFNFSRIMLSRERNLKKSVYPMIAMGLILPFIFIWRFTNGSESTLIESKVFFFIYYIAMMMLPVGIYYIFTEYHKASWIYNYLPIKNPGEIIKGAQLGLFFKFHFPIMIFTFAIFSYLWKFTITLHLIVILLNMIIIQLSYFMISKRTLPFSVELKTGRISRFRSASYYLAVFVFIPIAGGIHFFMSFLGFGLLVLIPLQILLIIAIFKNYYKIEWKDIEE